MLDSDSTRWCVFSARFLLLCKQTPTAQVASFSNDPVIESRLTRKWVHALKNALSFTGFRARLGQNTYPESQYSLVFFQAYAKSVSTFDRKRQDNANLHL